MVSCILQDLSAHTGAFVLAVTLVETFQTVMTCSLSMHTEVGSVAN